MKQVNILRPTAEEWARRSDDASARAPLGKRLRLVPIEERFRVCRACGAVCPYRWTGCRHCGAGLPQDIASRHRWGVALPLMQGLPDPSESQEIEVIEGAVLAAELCLDSPPALALERSMVDLVEELASTATGFGSQVLNGAGGPAFLFPSTADAAIEAAARAALAMLERWRGSTARRGGWLATDVPLRLGINVGLLYRHGGKSGGAFRGGCLAGAEALARVAGPGKVLVSESVFPHLARSFDLVAIDPASLRTAEPPGFPYLVVGEKAASPQDAPNGFTSPFVGRQRELAVLRQHLDEAFQGVPRVVHLVGEPGAGKSRLIEEFTLDARLHGKLDGVAEIRAGGAPYGGGLLHSLRSALLAPLGRVDGGGDLERELRQARLGEVDRKMLTEAALGIGTAASGPRHLAMAVGRFLKALAEDRGLLLVLDDLHWMDRLSLEVWRQALDEVEGRALIILSYRPSFEAEVGAWGGKRRTVLRLAPLSDEELARLESALAGSTPGTGDDRTAVNQSGGNPLYLEQALGLLADRRQGRNAETSLPETLHGVILARLELLADTAEALSRVSSVWMSDMVWERNRALAELEKLEIQMGRWLDRLETWTQEGREEIARYLDLLEGVDFSLTLAAMRLGVARPRHRRLPHSIERLVAGSTRELLAKLEGDLEMGGDGLNTALRAERLASRLLALRRAEEAARFYALAIRAAEATGEGARWGASRLREKQGDALREAGDAKGAACCYEALLETAGSDDDRLRLRIKAAASRREALDNELARRHLEAAGDSVDARVERALVALGEGKSACCRRQAGLALEAQASAWRAHAVLARLSAREGDRREARRHVRQMLDGCLLLNTGHERQEALAALEACGVLMDGHACPR